MPSASIGVPAPRIAATASQTLLAIIVNGLVEWQLCVSRALNALAIYLQNDHTGLALNIGHFGRAQTQAVRHRPTPMVQLSNGTKQSIDEC